VKCLLLLRALNYMLSNLFDPLVHACLASLCHRVADKTTRPVSRKSATILMSLTFPNAIDFHSFFQQENQQYITKIPPYLKCDNTLPCEICDIFSLFTLANGLVFFCATMYFATLAFALEAFVSRSVLPMHWIG